MPDQSKFNWDALGSQPGPPTPAPQAPKETNVFSQASAGFHEELGSAYHALKNVAGVFDSAVRKVQRFTGKDETWSKNYITGLMEEMEEHQKQSADQAGPPQSGVQSFARSAGAAPVKMGEFGVALAITRRPAAAMAAVEAAKEADKGWFRATQAGAAGFASGKALSAGDNLSMVPRVATNTAVGAATALAGGQGIKGAITQGLAQGALSAIGMPGKPKEKLSPQERLDMVTQTAAPHLNAVKRIFAADTLSKAASDTAGNVAERFAVADLERNRAFNDLESARTFFDKQPKDLNLQFHYGYQKGKVPPGMEKIAADMKSVSDKMWDDLHERGLIYSYVDNYLPGIYKDPKAAEKALQGLTPRGTGTGGSGPMRGSRSFKYQKKYQNAEIAKATAGLELISNNPVDVLMAGMMQGRKAIAAHDLMNEEISQGRGMWKRFGKPLPKDKSHWVTPNRKDDPTFVKYAKPPSKGSPSQGAPGKKEIARFYGEPDSINLINNHLDPGLSASPTAGAAFRGLRAYSNFENMLHFGLSYRHAVTTGVNALAESFAEANSKMMRGEFGPALKEYATAGTLVGAPVRDYIQGAKFRKQLLKMNPVGSEGVELVDRYLMGGGRAGRDLMYRTDLGHKFRNLWAEGKIVRGGLMAPLVPLEKMSNVVMNKVVPNIKLGAAYRRLELQMQKMGPNATRDDMRREARNITTHIDNIMGEIVYDNRFAPKIVKDIGQMIFQAPGWNWGSVSTVYNTLGDLIKSGPKALRDSPHASYVLGLTMATAYIGAVTQLVMGQGWPKSFDDYMHPRDGSTDVNGNPGRVHTPNYISNDGFSFVHDPMGTVVNKLNSLISQAFELGSNKDWQGRRIAKPEHGFLERQLDRAKWYGKQQLPYSITQGLANEDQSGESGLSEWVLPQVGINKSPLWISESPAERLGSDIMAGKGGFTSSEERDAAYKKEKQLASKLRQGKDIGDEVSKEVEEGRFGKADVQNAYKSGLRKHIEILINRADMDEALAIYQKARPEEKELIKPYLYRKLRSLKTKGAAERERIFKQFNDVVGSEDISGGLPASQPSPGTKFNWGALQ